MSNKSLAMNHFDVDGGENWQRFVILALKSFFKRALWKLVSRQEEEILSHLLFLAQPL